MRICDLHTHSTCSDGSDTPEELLELALKAGLGAIALTDHNNIEGLSRFYKASRGKPIYAIGGCEFSTDYEGQELHLIGMFISEDKFDEVRKYVNFFTGLKIQSNYDIISRLKDAGYPVDVEEFKNSTNAIVPNRVHVANYLMSKGVIQNKDEAFNTILKDGGPFYYSARKPDFVETIDFIHSIGGVAIWAHPLFHVNKEKCLEVLRVATKLDAMECHYTTYSKEEIEWSLETADDFDLVASGGSDYHGTNKPKTKLAVGYGDLEVPFSCYENLVELKKKYNEK